MTQAIIQTLANGDVQVSQEYFDGEEMAATTRVFRQLGSYVYQVSSNGATHQTCAGLLPTGPTLMGGDDLEKVIRKTLA